MQDHPKIQQDESGNLYLNFGQYGSEVEVACFSGDGMRLLTVEAVGVAKVWQINGAQPMLISEIRPTSPLDGAKEAPTTCDFETYIEAAALNQQGNYALLGLNDGTAGVFDVESGERLSTLHIAEEHVYGWELIRSVAYSPDDSFVVVGFFNRSAGVWDQTGRKLIAKLIPEYAHSFFSSSNWERNTLSSTVSVSSDNRYVFVGCADLTFTIWDLKTLKPVMSATDHVEDILATRLVNNVITWVTTGGAIWRQNGNVVEKLLETNQHLREAAISADGNVVVTRSSDNVICKTLVTGETELLAKLDASQDSDYVNRTLIGFCSSDRSNEVFYPDSNATLVLGSKRCFADCSAARHVSVSADNSIIAAIGDGAHEGLVWDVASNTRLLRSGGYVMAQAISFDSRMFAESVSPLGDEPPFINIRSLSLDEGKIEITQTLTTHMAEALEFSRDGKYLYSAAFAADATIRRWELQSDGITFIQVAVIRLKGLSAIKLLNNGNLAALRSYDGLEVWTPDLSTQICSCRVQLEHDGERSWSISDDQKFAVVGSDWGSLSKINLETGELETITPPYTVPGIVPSDAVTIKRSGSVPADSEVYILGEGLQPTARALLWRQPFGSFFHYGDGPRGWVKPLALSTDGKLTLVPCRSEIGVVSIADCGQEVESRFPFEGVMRAGRIAGRVALAVNSKGHLFKHEIPNRIGAE